MTLNFFFDIDGTLLPLGLGPRDSAVEAMQKARSQGHRMFLCSGRSQAEYDPRLSAFTFDGGIFSGGGTVVLGDKVLYRRRLTMEERVYGSLYLAEKGFLIMAQTDKGTFMNQECLDFFYDNLKKYVGRIIDVPNLIVGEVPEGLEVNKYLAFSPSGNAQILRRDLASRFDIVDNTVGLPQSMASEIVIKGMTKATGIAKMLSYLGEERESAVGVGDGANDMEMVEYCGLGVAMGNASPGLKQIADYITGDANGDGIKEAIQYATGEYLNKLQGF